MVLSELKQIGPRRRNVSPEHDIDSAFSREPSEEVEITASGSERELENLMSRCRELFQRKYEILEAQPRVAEAKGHNLQLLEQLSQSRQQLEVAEASAEARLSPSLDDLRTYRRLIDEDISHARHSLAALESEASDRQWGDGRSTPDSQRPDERPIDVIMKEIDGAKQTVRWYAEERVKAQSRQAEARSSILNDPEVVRANEEQIRLRLEQEAARDDWQSAMRQAMGNHPALVEIESQLDSFGESIKQAEEEVRRRRRKADEEIRGLR